MITTIITKIDQAVKLKVAGPCEPPTLKYKAHGKVKPQYIQLEKKVGLVDSELKKVTIQSTEFDYQSAHVLNSGRPFARAMYGAYDEHLVEVSLTYLGVSKNESDVWKALQGLHKVGDVTILDFSLQSENVVQSDWRMSVNDQKNYDPNCFAFKINYTIKIESYESAI
jgi:hypothetical protein